jgi:RNA polymerase sigma-70 factor (ECF subfamily)
MSQDLSFEDLIRRLRQGDEQAATELVRTYEPAIRRAIRVWLTDPRLCSVMGSMDVWQSILRNFFPPLVANKFDLSNPQQLIKLLKSMARNKVCEYYRRDRAQRRGGGRVQTLHGIPEDTPDKGKTPSEIIMEKDLKEQIDRRLSAQERWLVGQWAQGRSLKEIAEGLGVTPKVVKRRLDEALNRVRHELHLDENSHD